MSPRRHNDASDRLAAALAERHPAGWGRDPGEVSGRSRAASSPAGAGAEAVAEADAGAVLVTDSGSAAGGRHARAAPADAPAWVRLPAGLAQARVAASRPAVVALLALAVGLIAVFGLRLVRAQELGAPVAPGGGAGSGPPTAAPSGDAATAGGAPSGTAGSGTPSPAPSSPAPSTQVVVHVVGQVRHPGVVDLPTGARVVDAITRAGGARSGADLAAVNLARPVVDGEQIVVPKPGQPVAAPPPAGAAGQGGGAASGARPGGGVSGGGSMVNINTADSAALDTLPGVGPVLAGRILAWRTEHGRFTSVDELGEVSGIGEKLLSQLRPLVTL